MTVIDMIQRIRQMPGGILGRPSAQTLYTFLSGFCYARKDSGVDDFQVLSRFGQMVHDRFKVSSAQGWAKIIEFHSATTDGEMKLFWQLWDEYCSKYLKIGKNGNGRNGQPVVAAKARHKRRG